MVSLYEVLYTSTITSAQSYEVIEHIARRSRIYNAAHRITGLLIYDGLRFCQHLEGAREDVVNLMATIGKDPRHLDVEVLFGGPLAERRFRHWAMAFTTFQDVEVLDRLERLSGPAALDAFKVLLSALDLDSQALQVEPLH